MKKLNTKVLFAVAGALLLSAGAFTAQALSKDGQRSNLINANIEALAGEGEANMGPYEFVNKHGVDLGGGAVQVICTCGGTGILTCC